MRLLPSRSGTLGLALALCARLRHLAATSTSTTSATTTRSSTTTTTTSVTTKTATTTTTSETATTTQTATTTSQTATTATTTETATTTSQTATTISLTDTSTTNTVTTTLSTTTPTTTATTATATTTTTANAEATAAPPGGCPCTSLEECCEICDYTPGCDGSTSTSGASMGVAFGVLGVLGLAGGGAYGCAVLQRRRRKAARMQGKPTSVVPAPDPWRPLQEAEAAALAEEAQWRLQGDEEQARAEVASVARRSLAQVGKGGPIVEAECCRFLEQVMEFVKAHPQKQTFQRIDQNSDAVSAKVLAVPGAAGLLEAAGWQGDEQREAFTRPPDARSEAISIVSEILRARLQDLWEAQVATTFAASEDGAPAELAGPSAAQPAEGVAAAADEGVATAAAVGGQSPSPPNSPGRHCLPRAADDGGWKLAVPCGIHEATSRSRTVSSPAPSSPSSPGKAGENVSSPTPSLVAPPSPGRSGQRLSLPTPVELS